MHDVQTGNPNHGDCQTMSVLCDFKMTLKQTMICLLNLFIWLSCSSTSLRASFSLAHLALVYLTLDLMIKFKGLLNFL